MPGASLFHDEISTILAPLLLCSACDIIHTHTHTHVYITLARGGRTMMNKNTEDFGEIPESRQAQAGRYTVQYSFRDFFPSSPLLSHSCPSAAICQYVKAAALAATREEQQHVPPTSLSFYMALVSSSCWWSEKEKEKEGGHYWMDTHTRG